jgi:hypothetical protein
MQAHGAAALLTQPIESAANPALNGSDLGNSRGTSA